MPQMAPISWLILFIVFSIAFMLFNILNYYCFYKKNNTFKNNENSHENMNKNLNWKW